MGKKSKRRDTPLTRSRVAPVALGEGEARYFEPEFRTVITPEWLKATDEAKTIQKGLEAGWLVSWEIGRKGTHIASRWVSACGNEDTIVSPDPGDDDWKSLVHAHVCRLAQWARVNGESSATG